MTEIKTNNKAKHYTYYRRRCGRDKRCAGRYHCRRRAGQTHKIY